jgi:HSP20 family protein
MVDTRKLKERVDTVSKEMKERVDRLSTEVKELQQQVKGKANVASEEMRETAQRLAREVKELQGRLKKKFIGVGEEVEETAERLSQEAKKLKKRIRDIVPLRKGSERVPVRVETKDGSSIRPLAFGHTFDPLYNELFSDFFEPPYTLSGLLPLQRSYFGTGWPLVDIDDTDKEILIKAEIPGVDQEALEVSVSSNTLTIRGERKHQEEKKSWNSYFRECTYGSFQRTIPLSSEVEREKIKAIYKHGVLTVTLPKTAAARGRTKRIKVKSA